MIPLIILWFSVKWINKKQLQQHLTTSTVFFFFLSAPASEEREMDAVEVERMLRLAEQCLERAKSFIGKNANPPDPASISASSSCSPVQSQLHQNAVLPAPTASSTGM